MKSLKSVAFGLIASLLMAAPACARTTHAPLPPADIHPALFVARDADSTMYLFGTVHVRPAGAPWGGPEAIAALAASEDVWTEVEISAAADAQAQALVGVLGNAPADKPLSSWLTADENERLARVTQRFNIPPAYLERMQPWLAAITLSLAPMAQAGYDPQSGVDRSIDAVADAAGKNRRAFETMDEQLHFIAGLSADAQHEMLLDAINESEAGAAELEELSGAWESGDTATLQRVVVDEMRDNYPELYEVLFRRRNAAWMEVLMHELEGAGVDFVAVGAGHIVGEEGLVAQLRARGVSVERVAPR